MVQNRFVKIIVLFLILSFNMPIYVMALDWDLDNEDMSDITDWADQDVGSGVSSQATFDSKSCMKLYVPDASAVTDYARRRKTLGSAYTDYTFEADFYIDEAGGTTEMYFEIAVIDTGDPNYIAHAKIYNNKIGWRLPDSGGEVWNYADAYIELDSWNRLRIIKDTNKVSIWLNDLLYIWEYSPFSGNYDDNQIRFTTFGGDDKRTVYIDFERLDTTDEHISTSPLNVYSEKIVIRYRQNTNDATYPNGVESLRMYGGTRFGSASQVLSVPLVATDDTNASKVRIYDGSNIKSLMKLPL